MYIKELYVSNHFMVLDWLVEQRIISLSSYNIESFLLSSIPQSSF